MLVGELEGLDETKSFINAATDGQVVDCDLTEDALRINDEQSTVTRL